MAKPVAFTPYLETPPQTQGRKAKFESLLIGIKKLPLGWYVIQEYDRPTTAACTAGNLKKRFPEFEFTSRDVDGKGKLYARWKGLTR